MTQETHPTTTTDYFAPLQGQTYMLLTTFKRDGTPVSTPVHLAKVDGTHVYFRTWHPSGKSKRLRHGARVEVSACTARGRNHPPILTGHARLLTGTEASTAAAALAAKHPILHGRLIPAYHRMRGWQTRHYELTPAVPA